MILRHAFLRLFLSTFHAVCFRKFLLQVFRYPKPTFHPLVKIKKKKTKLRRISRQPSPVQIMIDQEQQQNVQYCNYLGSMITNDARRTREIKSRIAMATAALTSKLDLNFERN